MLWLQQHYPFAQSDLCEMWYDDAMMKQNTINQRQEKKQKTTTKILLKSTVVMFYGFSTIFPSHHIGEAYTCEYECGSINIINESWNPKRM